MCGIIGYYVKGDSEAVSQIFDQSLETIKDRGIFMDLYTKEGREFFGYARLPTDDIHNTSLNEIQKICGSLLLYNGLITNTEYLQQRFDLPKETSNSDTLCLLHGFHKCEAEFISVCRGMFALAYVTTDYIVLVRDTIGIKPMYYTHNEQYFAFCSEIKGLRNPFSKVIEVKPGEIVMFNKQNHQIITRNYNYQSYRHFQPQDLQTCLIESIVKPTERYLKQSHDKKIGLLLSGGVDSSVILKLLYDHLKSYFKERIKVFCLGVEGSTDLAAAQRLTNYLGIKLIQVSPYGQAEALKEIPQIVYKVESPLSRVVRVAILQDALGKKIQEMGIQVLLSGEGSDELFYGYDRFINGLTEYQIQNTYQYFSQKVFYYTLLQRFERIFARRQIEGRVPYLDQELIELTKKIPPSQSIGDLEEIALSKLPLRQLAKEIGLPQDQYKRKKETMTFGATKFPNCDNTSGYLESYIAEHMNISFKEIIKSEYIKHYYINGKDLYSDTNILGTEEHAFKVAKYLHKLSYKHAKTYFI